ncbi:MAG: sigma-70 family RNA polymerase sigma factor [Bacilli bacterium]|nr:sigma-70 family RNA polymerase sigma factor [Bacilli bacterium]
MIDYSNLNDNELYMLVCEQHEDAKEILLNKYKYIINLIVKKYMVRAKMVGMEYNDLYQEALLGFSDALVNFNEYKSSLATFVSICVERRLQKVVKINSSCKNKIMLDALSLEYKYVDLESELKDLISDKGKNDPLNNITSEETINTLTKNIRMKLSDNEYEVYELLINGFTYSDIAKILNKSYKSIDGTIQRIKGKVKQILNEPS